MAVGKPGPDPRPILERLHDAYEVTDSGCWQWQGSLVTAGYGYIHYQRKLHRAHRLAYELLIGPIPDGLTLDHLCRNRACVNPAHLEPVTRAVNTARGASPTAVASRTDTCKSGRHRLEGRNAQYRKNGTRICGACRAEYARKYRQRKAVTA